MAKSGGIEGKKKVDIQYTPAHWTTERCAGHLRVHRLESLAYRRYRISLWEISTKFVSSPEIGAESRSGPLLVSIERLWLHYKKEESQRPFNDRWIQRHTAAGKGREKKMGGDDEMNGTSQSKDIYPFK